MDELIQDINYDSNLAVIKTVTSLFIILDFYNRTGDLLKTLRYLYNEEKNAVIDLIYVKKFGKIAILIYGYVTGFEE